MTTDKRSDLLQFFAYEHLPPHLHGTSQPFAALAARIHDEPENAEDMFGIIVGWLQGDLPANAESREAIAKIQQARGRMETQFIARELGFSDWNPFWRDVVLRLVLEAKDCAVRARIFKL